MSKRREERFRPEMAYWDGYLLGAGSALVISSMAMKRGRCRRVHPRRCQHPRRALLLQAVATQRRGQMSDDGTLTQRERIEEAHGVWELAAQRVCAMAELISEEGLDAKYMLDHLRLASIDERRAFTDWQITMQGVLEE